MGLPLGAGGAEASLCSQFLAAAESEGSPFSVVLLVSSPFAGAAAAAFEDGAAFFGGLLFCPSDSDIVG